MKLYIANTSRQDWMFNVRPKPGMRVLTVMIKSGRQEQQEIPDDVKDAVISSLHMYGAVERKELSRHPKDFQGLVFSFDKPISENDYHYGNEEHLDQSETRSVIEASKAAMASDMVVNPRNRDRVTGKAEVEMEEETPMRGQKRKTMKLTVDPSLSRGDNVPLQ